MTWISDTVSGSATDNAWGQGDKSDCFRAKTGGDATACVTQVFGIGASKTDLQYHGIGLEKGSDGHDYLYSGIKRLNAGGITSSNANYNVEVNQLLDAYKPSPESTICPTGTTGGCNIWRSPGDLTFMTDWGGNQSSCNTATPAICAYVWIDKSTGTGKTPSPAASTCFNAKTDPCWGLLPGTAADISANPLKAFGSINSGASTQPFTFTEIGVDLTASGLVGSGECRTFKDVWAHSRSSSSFTAELKDFIFGDVSISTCTTTETNLQRVDCATNANIGDAAKTLTAALAVNGSFCLKDIASVGGGATSGTVNFRYYSSEALCNASDAATTGTNVSSNTVNGSGVATSDKVTFTTAGSRWFRAFFSGGGLSPSTSDCDEIVVLSQNTSTSTLLHVVTDSTGNTDVTPTQNALEVNVTPGSWVKDVATVNGGASGTPTGTVSFKVYGNATDCGNDASGTASGTNVALTSGSASSTAMQFNNPGDFYWRAFYTGTGSFNNSSSPCNEIVHVSKISTAISTAQKWLPQDTATVAPSVAGTVVFSLYESADCSGTAAATFTDSDGSDGFLTNNSTYYTASKTISWSATFTPTNTTVYNGSTTTRCEKSVLTITNDSGPFPPGP